MKSKIYNRFFVCFSIIYIIIFYLLFGIGLFTWYAIDTSCDDITLSIIFAFMLLFLPFLLFVWAIIFLAPRLKLTEEGIIKTWFGHIIINFKWEELKFIYYKGNLNQWVCISIRDLSKKSLTRNQMTKGVIYFFKTEKKMRILEQYIPDKLKNQIKLS